MKMMVLLLALTLSFMGCSQPEENLPPNTKPDMPNTPIVPKPPQGNKIKVVVNDVEFTATIVDNSTATSFASLLPMTITMSDMNDNEKYCSLPQSLPTNAYNPRTIESGDIMLFGSRTLVLFYETFPSSYSYTKIGSIDNPSNLKNVLGDRSVHVKFEIIK